MKKIAAGFLLLLALLAELAFAQALVKDTKHNLSATAITNPIRAAAGGTTEICVFCHTPHGASTSGQLWNRALSTATYTPYTSDYLTGLGYPTAALGNSSRLCLSCHDGTVALGSVFNTPGSGTTGSIAMQNVTPITGTPALTDASLAGLKPGDLLFWTGTYDTGARTLPISHVMLYLGKTKAGRPVMFGASDGRPYQGKRQNGVSVFDFRIPAATSKSKFAGYGPIPGLDVGKVRTVPPG